MSLAEPYNLAHRPVDERLVDVFDEHDLSVFFQDDAVCCHEVGKNLVSLLGWSSRALSRVRQLSLCLRKGHDCDLHRLPCMSTSRSSTGATSSDSPAPRHLVEGICTAIAGHQTKTPMDIKHKHANSQLGWLDSVVIEDFSLQRSKPLDRRRAHSPEPHLVEHVDECLITLPEDLGQVDARRDGLAPRERFEGERRRLVVFGHGRELEKVARDHDLTSAITYVLDQPRSWSRSK
jgi:hypothetical protein